MIKCAALPVNGPGEGPLIQRHLTFYAQKNMQIQLPNGFHIEIRLIPEITFIDSISIATFTAKSL